MALAEFVSEFDRPTSLDIYRAVASFIRSSSPDEIRVLNDLGKRLVPSEAQWLAITAWREAFKRTGQAPGSLGTKRVRQIAEDYVRFSDEITRRALEADEVEALNEAEATHVELADMAQWQRLRRALHAIQNELGDRWQDFLAWSRSVVPQRAQQLLAIAELENST